MKRLVYLYLVICMAGFVPGFPVTAKAVGLGHASHSHSKKNIPIKYKRAVTGVHQHTNKSILVPDINKRKLKGTDRHAAGLTSIEWSASFPVSEPDSTIRKSPINRVTFLYNKRGPPALS